MELIVLETTSSAKKCPFCAETIMGEAIRCRYCGADLQESSQAPEQQRIAIIARDIQVGGQVAFQRGDRVAIETVSPDANRPEYKYVVVSKGLNKEFRLSEKDFSFE